jgi:hypothetical protein
MNSRSLLHLVLVAALAGCATRGGGEYGSTHTHRFQQPPAQAARCFARNAEDHSSALVSEVTATRDGGAHVAVQVKNGVPYASADFRRSGSASVAAITLMVRTSGRQNDLLDALVLGC